MRRALLPFAVAALAASSAAGAENPQQQTPVAQNSDAALNDDVRALQRHLDAYRSGDLDRFVATFAPDAVVRADGFVAIGHDQIKALYSLNFVPGAPTIRVHDRGLNGERIYISVGYVFEDGQEMCCSYSEYEITNGRISFLEARG